jgi:hypothetical protein
MLLILPQARLCDLSKQVPRKWTRWLELCSQSRGRPDSIFIRSQQKVYDLQPGRRDGWLIGNSRMEIARKMD